MGREKKIGFIEGREGGPGGVPKTILIVGNVFSNLSYLKASQRETKKKRRGKEKKWDVYKIFIETRRKTTATLGGNEKRK